MREAEPLPPVAKPYATRTAVVPIITSVELVGTALQFYSRTLTFVDGALVEITKETLHESP